MTFIEKLIQSILEKKSVVCMGLDPRLEQVGQIPEFLKKELEEPDKIILEFNKELIEKTHDLIPIIKPQMAFYEKYEALNALKETIKFAHKNDLLVILDSKRNDIGSTSEAYAYTNYNVYKADACTINAYFGIDGVKPFLDYKDKGVFVLIKTSNPSSREFQDLYSVRLNYEWDINTKLKGKNIKLERNYTQMAKLVKEWGKELEKFSGYHNLGAVVGATYPKELKNITDILENSFILIPGYGAQGAQAEDIKFGFDENGLGGIVNSSRGLMFAYHNKKIAPERFAEAARDEIIDMNQKINKEIGI
jgi:orotidine-5'-phosphate decarboxylase